MSGTAAGSVLVVMSVLLAGCQWMSTGWDASGSADNSVDTQISVANVSSLHLEWKADPGTGQDAGVTPVITGNTLVTVAKTNEVTAELDAYPANGTTGCTSSPRSCVPLWRALGSSFSQPLAVDGVVYVDNTGVLDAYDAAGVRNCSGTPRVCLPLWSGTGGGRHPIFEDGTIYVAAATEIDAYPTDTGGCTGTPVVCHPVAVYQTANVCGVPSSCPVAAIVADHDRLYASLGFPSTTTISFPGHTVQEPTISQYLAAYDIGGSGTPTWLQNYDYELGEPPAVSGLMDVDGQIYTTGSAGSLLDSGSDAGLRAFNPTGSNIWRSRLLVGSTAETPDAVFAAGPSGVVACAPATGCGAATASDPLTPLRTYDPDSHGVTTGPVVGDDVVYVGGDDALLAYDATGHVGCTGDPVVCEPVATIGLDSAEAREVIVSNGRVYVATSEGALMAFGH